MDSIPPEELIASINESVTASDRLALTGETDLLAQTIGGYWKSLMNVGVPYDLACDLVADLAYNWHAKLLGTTTGGD